MPDDMSDPQSAIIARSAEVLAAGGFGNFANDIVVARGKGRTRLG